MNRLVSTKIMASFLALGFVLAGAVENGASAGERRARIAEDGPQLSEHPKSHAYHKRRPQVRGYVQRRGGYSYSYLDGELDYRDTSILRDTQNMRRQGGPFDSGFFFDSGISRHNESPYLN